MKHLLLILTTIFLMCATNSTVFAQDSSTKEETCEAARKQCTQGYLYTNAHGVQMVTPKGHEICWAGYHQCMGT